MNKDYISPSMKATQMHFRAQLLAGSANFTKVRKAETNLNENEGEGLKVSTKHASVNEAYFR